jgi:hypothetical protein
LVVKEVENKREKILKYAHFSRYLSGEREKEKGLITYTKK